TFQNHTNRPLTDFGGKTSIFSHPVYLFLREFSLQDFRGGSVGGMKAIIMPHCIDNTEPEALTYCFTHDPCWGNLTTLRCV
ncbi:hypothetical protein, partial [Escherichia coli]|uniref:hypothetical protein n=1 Tax=Escherichia coli TaxID=562 RepID=UPI0039F07269